MDDQSRSPETGLVAGKQTDPNKTVHKKNNNTQLTIWVTVMQWLNHVHSSMNNIRKSIMKREQQRVTGQNILLEFSRHTSKKQHFKIKLSSEHQYISYYASEMFFLHPPVQFLTPLYPRQWFTPSLQTTRSRGEEKERLCDARTQEAWFTHLGLALHFLDQLWTRS